MNPSRFYFLAVAILGLATTTHAVPNLIQYQGQVSVGGTPFTGNGTFNFSIVDAPAGGTSLWDSGDVPLTVQDGIYSLTLGESGVTAPIPATVFQSNSDLYLRVWFDDGTSNGKQQLTPDQRIAAVGFAIKAGQAATVADGAVTESMLADGAVSSEKLADGIVDYEKLTANNITSGGFADFNIGNTTGALLVLVNIFGTNANANKAELVLCNPRNTAFGGGRQCTIIGTAHGSTGTSSEISVSSYSIPSNGIFRVTASTVGGSNWNVQIRKILL